MSEVWKSPRKVEEELREYKLKRFEAYMTMEDNGVLTRELALAAFRDELDYGIFIPGIGNDERVRTQ